MKRLFTLILFTLVLFIGCSHESKEKVSLTISAAISLTDALEEIKEVYEKEHDTEIVFNLGGSGSLAQQIQQGAPVAVFISANQQWMDTLEDENLIFSESRADVTGNNLVLIAGIASPIAYQSFTEISANDIDKIAIGNPESVPAGKYTEEVLLNLEIWEQLAEKLVLAKDVRQVLTYVETGNADIGFVYESDALGSDQIKVLATADKHLHEPIIYPAAVITDTKHEQEARDFVSFMATDQAQEVLEKYGFKK